ncbi:glycosyltransferase family 25 protein [Anderseniella sp. Alg231-50]|uniref:glycosyltransferase family 25 protein n=1 Tax=Anderseniella sp. Alg231-50 TaxID=1922226 RepID=UPI000D55CB1A
MIGYVITIFGLPHSENGAARCIETGHRHGITGKAFAAVNKFKAEKLMHDMGLFPNPDTYSRIADDPIGDRATQQKGQWHLTRPELGCALSHYLVWCKAARASEPTLVLEHDAILVGPVPEIPEGALAVNYQVADAPGTAGYLLTPAGANLAVAQTRRKGVQPSDELLWRSALRGLPVHHEQRPVIAIEDYGVSTIQWTRSDPEHAHINKRDPWEDFEEPPAD